MRFPRGACYEITINDMTIKFKLLNNFNGMPNVAQARICETGEIIDAYELLCYDITSLIMVDCDGC